MMELSAAPRQRERGKTMIAIIHTEEDFDRDIRNAGGYTLLNIYDAGCRPCRLMGTVIEKAAAAMEGRVRFCRAEISETGRLTERFQLVGVPTCILFENGREKGRIIGYHDLRSFREKLEELL